MKTWTVNSYNFAEWIGQENGNVNYPTTFRITCSPGKKVSVFEGDWIETGGDWSSDISTMISSNSGTCSGTKFLTYMPPPSYEQNVRNPFTGKLFNDILTHVYLYADKDTAHITVTDAYTGGKKLKRTYTIAPNRYADCYLNVTDYDNIYNGSGTNSGPARPYLLIQSDNNISAMISNFNDNWMMYFGSAQTQSFKMGCTSTKNYTNTGDTFTVVSQVAFNTNSTVNDVELEVHAESGLKLVSSEFTDLDHKNTIKGTINKAEDITTVMYKNIPNLDPKGHYIVTNKAQTGITYNDGTVIPKNCVLNIETMVSGYADGCKQQAVGSEGIAINGNTSGMMFSAFPATTFDGDSTDSWTCSAVDINNDGYDDLFFSENNLKGTNLLYINNRSGGFYKQIKGSIAKDISPTVNNTWGDVDNNGTLDLLSVNNTRKPCYMHLNDGTGNFKTIDAGEFTDSVSYYHSAAFVDYDRDGKLDLFISNYQPTRFNELFHNEGNGEFKKVEDGVISNTQSEAVGNTWADYDNDGFPDLLVLDNRGGKNKVFHNNGNGTFRLDSTSAICKDGGYSVGSCWGDIDNDGDLDLFIANTSDKKNYLYINNGNGTFTKDITSIVSNDTAQSHGCSFVDVDNDGDLDLYVTNDHGLKFLYLNDGKGHFTKVTNDLVNANYGSSFGHAWGDFNHDGYLDLAVATHGHQPNRVFLNNGKGNNWVSIKLVGTVSNKSAVGARVYVKANNIWQMSEVNSQSGFGGQSSYRQHFGLGKATVIDSIKIWWPSGLVDYYTSQKVNQFLTYTEKSAIAVSGIVYNDANGNCKMDSGETAIPYAELVVNSNHIYSNSQGVFATELPAGTYSLSVVQSNSVNTTVCSSTKITVSKSAITNIMLPAVAVCQKAELGITMGFTALRKGFNNKMKLSVVNNGQSSSSSYLINLNLDKNIFLKSGSIPWSSSSTISLDKQTYNNYCWKMDTLAAAGEVSIDLVDSVGLSAVIGNPATLNAGLENVASDCNMSNNTVSATADFVGAVDPNEKYVSPSGFISANQELTYRIVFQNVGNGPASFAVITDDINPVLDMSTIKYLSSSSPASITTKGRTVTWKLNNMNLPDTLTDKTGSTGYVMFSIKPEKGLPNGQEITNQASIVFDYNDPIMTSTTMNNISQDLIFLDEKVMVYPNPAHDLLTVDVNKISDHLTAKELDLYSYMGQLIRRIPYNGSNMYQISLTDLNSGVYFLHVTMTDGSEVTKQFVVE